MFSSYTLIMTRKFHETPQISGQQYGVPHGVPRVFINSYDENVFKILKFLRQTLSLFPEQSTLTTT
jgi:hypothetical protein